MDETLSFERSSYCASSCCVEVAIARQSGSVLVRNSQNPDARIAFSAEEWQAFLAGVKSNEFDV